MVTAAGEVALLSESASSPAGTESGSSGSSRNALAVVQSPAAHGQCFTAVNVDQHVRTAFATNRTRVAVQSNPDLSQLH